MNTSGKVIWVDKTRGMFKVKCSNHRTALVEILDFIDINIDDTISGDLMDYRSSVSLYSQENDEHFEGLIQDLD